jgi:hypothetical protein
MGSGYIVNGVKFDGYVAATGVLQDAKALGYAKWVEDGVFKSNFFGADEMVKRAVNQLAAAGGTARIEWVFAEEAAANATRALFQERGITGITIRYVAPIRPTNLTPSL